MPMLIDITPSNVSLLHNGVAYRVEEVMKSGNKLLITAVPFEEEKHDDLILEPNN